MTKIVVFGWNVMYGQQRKAQVQIRGGDIASVRLDLTQPRVIPPVRDVRILSFELFDALSRSRLAVVIARPLSFVSRFNQSARLPLWLKLMVTLLYVLICRGTWKQYSMLNFLWFSYIGFMGTVVALWFENRLLASMMLLNSFIADGVGWTFDLLVALVSGHHPLGATA